MAITPISGISLTKHNNISFGRSEREFNEYQPTQKTSNLKRVPVMVLIAMSPINAPNSMATIPETHYSPEIEMPQKKSTRKDNVHSPIKIGTWSCDEGREHMKYYMYDCAGNPKDAELVGFEYNKDMSNNRTGVLKGIITAFSTDVVSGNRYLMAYQEVDPNTGDILSPRVCTVPLNFSATLIKFHLVYGSAYLNEKAIKHLDSSEFKNALKIKDLNNIPPIEYEYNVMRLPNGKENRVQRPSQK